MTREKLSPEELELYQAGFKVAVNFLYHHQASEENRSAFERYLNEHMDPEVVREAINMRNPENDPQSGGPCPPGFCPTPNGCVLCEFQNAFDGSYYTGNLVTL